MGISERRHHGPRVRLGAFVKKTSKKRSPFEKKKVYTYLNSAIISLCEFVEVNRNTDNPEGRERQSRGQRICRGQRDESPGALIKRGMESRGHCAKGLRRESWFEDENLDVIKLYISGMKI